MTAFWQITDKGDQRARALVDGESVNALPHYSRQTPGAAQFTRNGQNLVFLTADALAVWVTFRPTPGKATRTDGLDAWECSLFRNEGPELSSKLIREAVELSMAIWGPLPRDGFITYVRPDCVKSGLAGYCYRRAGWRRIGYASDGKPMFKAPRPAKCAAVLSTELHGGRWSWSGARGGKLRELLEAESD